MARIARIKNRAVKMKGRKIKKWAKGHSSDSNPTTTRYRDMAASSRFVINEAASMKIDTGFTGKKLRFQTNNSVSENESLLRKLKLDDKEDGSRTPDDESETETAETQFSRFTNCTNPTFNKVHRLWKSGSELQNDVLSVLAAITEVVKKSGGQESEVEYFAALLTSFASNSSNTVHSTSEEGQNILNTLSATAYLISLVITKIPYAVLISRFSPISQIFFERLSQNAENPRANALLRYVVDSFGVLLKAQPAQSWESPILSKMCDSLLVFCVDERPKIRKSAQRALGGIINNEISATPAIIHPAAKLCAQFCAQTIDKCGGDGKTVNSTLYSVQLLKKCMHNFGQSQFKSCAETLLKLLTLCSATVSQSVQDCFLCTLANKPTDRTLTSETNGQLILAFYDFEPSKNDQSAYLLWCRMQLEAHCCLVEKDPALASNLAPKFFDKLLTQLTVVSEKEHLSQSFQAIKRFFKDCLQSLVESKSLSRDSAGHVGQSLKDLLNLKYVSVWPACFEILSSFFETISKTDADFVFSAFDVKNLIKSMGELRESENFTLVVPLEKCLGNAVKFLGPERILNAIKLSIDPDLNLAADLPNSWLLPVLRNNVQKANLSHFINTFLPTAVKLKQRLDQLNAQQAEKYVGEKQILQTLQQQIWDLLPAYCKSPLDLAESFKRIAKILGYLLSDTPALRLTVLNCLRTLILRCEPDADKSEMARFAPNFLPILFRLFLNDSTSGDDCSGYDFKGVRLACLETIRIYLTITPSDCLKRYLDVALGKIKADASAVSPDQKHRIMDELIAMVKYLDKSCLIELFDVVKAYCNQTKDKSMQKKAYRVLEEAFGRCDSHDVKSFFETEQIAIKTMLFSNLGKANPSTKASRIRCLSNLFENGFLSSSLLPDILPGIVTTLKENNVKTRRSAALFFITACNLAIAQEKDIQKGTKIVWDCLLPLFESQEPQEICCAIIAARLFVFEFKNDCPSDMLSTLLSWIIGRISDENRQIVQCCLEFLKTFVSCTSQTVMGLYLELFVPALYTQSEDCQHHFRFLTRKILAKLMRKISYELIFKLVPAGPFQKQLNNVRKMLQRYEKKKVLGSAGENCQVDDDLISGVTGLSRPETIADMLKDTSDEDSDEEGGVQYDKPSDRRSRRSRRSVSVPVFLQEGDDNGEILDFLDTKSISMMTTCADRISAKSKSERKNHGFKTDDKGRLIIGASDENENITKETIDLTKRKVDSDNQGGSKKRKKIDFTRDDEDSDIDEALHYKPGGSGIHRVTNDDNLREDGSQFKAKKAKGDVKKGSMQPYAYVPFDFKQLNRRKRAKSAGKYRHLMQGAQKGATKGSKGRKKSGKM